MEIGAKLRKLRESQGLSLQDVAARANVSLAHVSRWELGTRNLDIADYIKLCGILGELPGDLLPHSDGVPLRVRPLVQMLDGRSDAEIAKVMKMVAVMLDIEAETVPLPARPTSRASDPKNDVKALPI